MSDVAAVMRIRIKQSKTDPFHQGVFIYLGKTDQEMCPITAMLPYLVIRGNHKALSDGLGKFSNQLPFRIKFKFGGGLFQHTQL